jgi:hypothetical protein
MPCKLNMILCTMANHRPESALALTNQLRDRGFAPIDFFNGEIIELWTRIRFLTEETGTDCQEDKDDSVHGVILTPKNRAQH